MVTLTNQKGVTYLSLVTTLTIWLILLPFLPFLYQALSQENFYDHIAAEQFFYFLFDEFNQANNYVSSPSSITFSYVHTDDEVTVSQYGNLIRRQVDSMGHEILLRGIRNMTIEELSYGVKVTIETLEGGFHAKIYPVP